MAIEILRPNAPGDECNIGWQQGAACPNHWQNVDEETPDEAATYVGSDNVDYLRDLYNIENHSVGSGAINHIIVYARCKATEGTGVPSLKICIKSNTTVTEDEEKTLTLDWVNYSKQWNVNPADSEPWEWSDIDALQIGIALKNAGAGKYSDCTQMYVEVDYTPVTAKTASDSGSGVDAKITGNPLVTFVKSDVGGSVDTSTGRALALFEAGVGIDVGALLGADKDVAVFDLGAGVEALGSRHLDAIEEGLGQELASLLARGVQDIGKGVDTFISLLKVATKFGVDSGVGTDAVTLNALLKRLDIVTGIEAIISRNIDKAEVGAGLDSKVSGNPKATLIKSDSGTGVEQCEKEYYMVGREMAVNTYTRPHLDLKTYTE